MHSSALKGVVPNPTVLSYPIPIAFSALATSELISLHIDEKKAG